MRRIALSVVVLFVWVTPLWAQHFAHQTEPVYKGVVPGGCSGCHGGTSGRLAKFESWSKTLHAQAYDSIAFVQNNPACLRCHTTGWDTTVANGGFDDFFRMSPKDTVGMAHMKNVQCESCHKPYTVGTAYDTSLVATKCGDCHGGDPHTPIYDNWLLSKHAKSKRTSIPGGSFNFIAQSPNCAGCHTAEGFLQFVAQGGNVPNIVPADTAKSADIACAACHDPHGSANVHQLRLPLTQICQKCHNPEYPADSVSTAGVGNEVHHSTAYMFDGVGGYHYAGVTYQSSAHTFAVPNKCVTCHLHTTPFQAGPPEVPAYTGHSFTPQKGACITCHANFDTTATGTFDYRRTQTICDSTAAVLAGKLSHATHADSISVGFKRAAFNLSFYEGDGSHGIHNTKYALGLLNSSIANFTPTGVEEVAPDKPLVFELRQNYPNPFNPSTVINFSIPQKSPVKLEVFDVLGHHVITLVEQEMPAGLYKVTWNGADKSGVKVASGMYLYRVEAGSFTAVKKMILVK